MATEQQQRGQDRRDHEQLNQLNSQVEAQQVDHAIPRSQPQLVQNIGEGQAVDQAKESAIATSRPGKSGAGARMAEIRIEIDQHLRPGADTRTNPRRRQCQRKRVTRA